MVKLGSLDSSRKVAVIYKKILFSTPCMEDFSALKFSTPYMGGCMNRRKAQECDVKLWICAFRHPMFSIFALAVDAFTLLAVHCQRTVIIVQVVTDPFVLQLHCLPCLPFFVRQVVAYSLLTIKNYFEFVLK